MAAWIDGPIIAFDLETTGLDILGDRIVQAALIVVGSDGQPEPGGWVGLIDPGVPIPRETSDIHGITDQMVRDDGTPAAEAIPQIAAKFVEYGARDLPVVMFNASFDWPFIRAEADRYGVSIPWLNVIDPLVCDRALDKYRRGRRNLITSTAHSHYGIALAKED